MIIIIFIIIPALNENRLASILNWLAESRNLKRAFCKFQYAGSFKIWHSL